MLTPVNNNGFCMASKWCERILSIRPHLPGRASLTARGSQLEPPKPAPGGSSASAAAARIASWRGPTAAEKPLPPTITGKGVGGRPIPVVFLIKGKMELQTESQGSPPCPMTFSSGWGGGGEKKTRSPHVRRTKITTPRLKALQRHHGGGDLPNDRGEDHQCEEEHQNRKCLGRHFPR